MNIRKLFRVHIALLAIITATVSVFSSCDDEIAEERRYTFTGKTVATFLEKPEFNDQYSSFVYMLKKGGRYNLMEAYGEYTCFAPTNDAVAQYLQEQYDIYMNPPLDDNGQPRDSIITGVYSTDLKELSAAKCREIVQSHIIPTAYKTNEIAGVIPTKNLNDRYISYDVAEGNKKMVNGYAEIVLPNNEVENGVVHAGLTQVLHLSTNTVVVQLEEQKGFTLFAEALKATGVEEEYGLTEIEDDTYECDGTEGAKYQANEATTARPLKRSYGFSIFAESDSVFKSCDIFTLNDLKEKCLEWYPQAANEEEALKEFVSYHIINQSVMWEYLCYVDIPTNCPSDEIPGRQETKTNRVMKPNADRVEYYETLNGHVLKVTVPRHTDRTTKDRIVNATARARQGKANAQTAKYRDIKITDPSTIPGFKNEARNGYIHVLENILIYDETMMKEDVLYDIIRIDFASLIPELRNGSMRWSETGKAGSPIYSSKQAFCLIDNTQNFLEHSKNFKVNNNTTNLFYLCPNHTWFDYQGDEMLATGKYDFSYKLPPVPAGEYEIRLGYSANELRGIVQFYLDDKVLGIPLALNVWPSRDPYLNYMTDEKAVEEGDGDAATLGTDECNAGEQHDKHMRNRGFMKAPTTSLRLGVELRNAVGIAASDPIRKIVSKGVYLSSGEEHWLRLKNVKQDAGDYDQGMHDYIELVPVEYINDESVSLYEKRK